MKYIKLPFLLFLTSCAHQSVEVVNNIAPSTLFIAQGNEQVNINWWENFEDKDLTAYVKQGLQDNLSLKANDLRLKSTAIDAKIADADLYPTLNLSSSAATSFDDFGKVENASLSLSSSWELDLWGQIDANINIIDFLAQVGATTSKGDATRKDTCKTKPVPNRTTHKDQRRQR